MTFSTHKIRRVTFFLAVSALLAGGSAAVAANKRPAGLSPQAYKADMIRGEALNQRYGIGVFTPSAGELARGAALNARYGNAWTRVSSAEFKMLVTAFGPDVMTQLTPNQARAELARGLGLNAVAKTYASSVPSVSLSAGSGFHWGDAGIGVAAAFGLMLLAAGAAIGFRKRNKLVLP
jgi:hypothetical protein